MAENRIVYFSHTNDNTNRTQFFNDWIRFVRANPNRRIQIQENVDMESLTILGLDSREKTHLLKQLFETDKATQIKTLTFLSTSIRYIPDEISRLTDLAHFFLHNGGVMQMGDVSVFVKLQFNPGIKTIDMRFGNMPQIVVIPSLFPNLETLTLINCNVQQILESFYQLPRLQEFDLVGNSLGGVLNVRLFEMQTLKRIILDNNRITQLPTLRARNDTLQNLSIQHNREIRVIPDSFTLLTGLRTLMLTDCNIVRLSEPIKNYFRTQFFQQVDNAHYLLMDEDSLEDDAFAQEYLDYHTGMENHDADQHEEYEDESDAESENIPAERPTTLQRLFPAVEPPISLPNPQPQTLPNPQPQTLPNPQPQTLPNPQPQQLPNPQPQPLANPQPQPAADVSFVGSNDKRFTLNVRTPQDERMAVIISRMYKSLNIQDPAWTIDETQTGYYAIQNENLGISEFLSRDRENMVIRMKDAYYLTKRTDILQVYRDCLFYKCRAAGNSYVYMQQSNIVVDTPIFDMKKVGIPLQYLYQINIDMIIHIMSSNHQHFVVQPFIDPQTGNQEEVASTMSKYVYDGRTSVSGNHCGTDQGGLMYALIPTVATRRPPTLLEEAATTLSDLTESNPIGFNATVVVKGNPQQYPITETTTVEELIAMMAARYNETLPDTDTPIQPSQIRLLFSGRYLENSQVVSQIPLYQRDTSTLLSVFRPATTGGRTHRRRPPRKRRTGRRKIH